MPLYKMLPAVLCLFLGCAHLASCGGAASSNENANANPSTTPAPTPDVGAMLKRMITQDGCKDFTADMRMTSADEAGKREHIDFKVQRKYGADHTSTFLSVLSPAEDSNKALLAVEQQDQPTQAYSYLPGLRKLTKINSDRRLGFHNAKVTVQDMLGMELGQYDHSPGERVSVDGTPLIKVEFKEKPYLNLAYPRIVGYFHEKDQSPAKFEIYDYRDELQKRVTVEEVKQIQNRQTITRMAIDDVQQKIKVSVETRKIEYDRGLSDNLFTEDRLKSFINNAVQRLDQQ
jgi:outer membrane lipoprotein-sorting protein